MQTLKNGSVICGFRKKVRVGYAPPMPSLGLEGSPGVEHDGVCVQPDRECDAGGHLMFPAWRVDEDAFTAIFADGD